MLEITARLSRMGIRWNRPEQAQCSLNSWTQTLRLRRSRSSQSARQCRECYLVNVTLLWNWLSFTIHEAEKERERERERDEEKVTAIYNASSIINAVRRQASLLTSHLRCYISLCTSDVYFPARTRMPAQTINFFLGYRVVAVVVTPCNVKEIP